VNIQIAPYAALRAEMERRERLIQDGKCPDCERLLRLCLCSWERGKVYSGTLNLG